MSDEGSSDVKEAAYAILSHPKIRLRRAANEKKPPACPSARSGRQVPSYNFTWDRRNNSRANCLADQSEHSKPWLQWPVVPIAVLKTWGWLLIEYWGILLGFGIWFKDLALFVLYVWQVVGPE